jgi:hypothetical protein
MVFETAGEILQRIRDRLTRTEVRRVDPVDPGSAGSVFAHRVIPRRTRRTHVHRILDLQIGEVTRIGHVQLAAHGHVAGAGFRLNNQQKAPAALHKNLPSLIIELRCGRWCAATRAQRNVTRQTAVGGRDTEEQDIRAGCR